MPTKKPVAKKIVIKKIAKKVTKKPVKQIVKKAVSKKPSKDLVYATDQQSFWTVDGDILNSLAALADSLDRMEKDVYIFHSSGEQNDFSVWVESVLCDDVCAAALRKAKTSQRAHAVVVRHLKFYTS